MANNTFVEYKFPNGNTIKCTVAFKFLLRLRSEYKSVYEALNEGLLYGTKEIFSAAMVLYGAYVCACYAGENGGTESIMTQTDFVDALEDDVMNVMVKCAELVSRKKN